MFLHRDHFDAERPRDLLVRSALHEQSPHIFLPRRKTVLRSFVDHRATLAVPTFAAYLSFWLAFSRSGMGQ